MDINLKTFWTSLSILWKNLGQCLVNLIIVILGYHLWISLLWCTTLTQVRLPLDFHWWYVDYHDLGILDGGNDAWKVRRESCPEPMLRTKVCNIYRVHIRDEGGLLAIFHLCSAFFYIVICKSLTTDSKFSAIRSMWHPNTKPRSNKRHFSKIKFD